MDSPEKAALNACVAAGAGGDGGDGGSAVMLCRECNFSRQAKKCEKHGARYAIYKCDCCCSIATYDCSGNHYCDRCHASPFDGACTGGGESKPEGPPRGSGEGGSGKAPPS